MAFRFLISGGTGNWNSTSNWSATSGGASGSSFPTASDDVVLDSGSTNASIVVNVASACLTFSASPDYVNTLTINGNLTFAGNLTLASGMTITTTSGVPLLSNTVSASTLTSNTKLWPYALTLGGNVIHTLADNLTIGGNVIAGNATGLILNGNNLICNAGFNQSTAGSINGTTVIKMNGSGTLSSGSGTIKNSVTIQPSGTTTIGSIFYNTGILTYISGTTSISGILTISNSATLETSGMTWNSVTFATTANQVCTINSTLSVRGTLTDSITMQFSGNSGFNTNTFLANSAGKTLTFNTGVTYTITSGITVVGTLASPIIFKSSLASTAAFVNLTNAATQDIGFCSGTDIDSSGGQNIFTHRGTLTRTVNWKLLGTPLMVSSIF